MTVNQRGFTLIELVAVVVILGILATATTQYIVFGTEVYLQANERQRVLGQSRFLVERLSRELKAALPNSIRTSPDGRCLEFVPIKTSGAYRTDNAATNLAPIFPNPATSTIDVISWDIQNSNVDDRFYIYATNNGEVYDQTNDLNESWGRILNVTLTTGRTAPEHTVTFKDEVIDTLASNDQFREESPISRFYTADHSVNFCLISGNVFRFERRDFGENQLTPIVATGVLMAEGLTNAPGERAFSYVTASQTRNSVVSLYLEFTANASENMFFNHEVHIPNVP